MLSRLYASTSSPAEPSDRDVLGDRRIFLDTETYRLVFAVPDLTWGRVARIVEQAVNPMYKGLYGIFEHDMEEVAQLFADLELQAKEPPSRSSSPKPIVITNPDPSIPTIVITTCSDPRPDSLCQVPYQDSAFHNQLTVPSAPSFNHAFPPMATTRFTPSRVVNHWVYKNGHWQAALLKEPRPRTLKNRRARKLRTAIKR